MHTHTQTHMYVYDIFRCAHFTHNVGAARSFPVYQSSVRSRCRCRCRCRFPFTCYGCMSLVWSFVRSFVRILTHPIYFSNFSYHALFSMLVLSHHLPFCVRALLCVCLEHYLYYTFGNSDANIPDSLFSVTMITLCVCVCVCVPIAFSITSSFARFTFSCAFNIRI